LLWAPINTVVVVPNISSTADDNAVTDANSFNTRDMHTLRNGHLVADLYQRPKTLIIVCGYRVQPEIAVNVEIGTKAYEPRPVDAASWSQVQPWRAKQPAKVCTSKLGECAVEEKPYRPWKRVRDQMLLQTSDGSGIRFHPIALEVTRHTTLARPPEPKPIAHAPDLR